MRVVVILLSLLGSLNLCIAQGLDFDSLDFYLESLGANEKFMGQVTAYQNEEIVFSKTTGFSNLELGTKSGKATKYRIGSISKTITAALILRAAEEGKLQLEQTIDTFFPSLEHAERITISDLLAHRSGIHNFTSDATYSQWNSMPKTSAEMIAIIAKGGSDFEPGKKAEYSNSNYVLLSYILERVYKKKYASILKREIAKPLRLRNTQFGDQGLTERDRTYSYKYEVNWKKATPTDESIPMGAGGIVMSGNDLALFIDGLFEGRIISNESLAMMTRQQDGYGMGIFETEMISKKVYTHDGVIDGFNSVFYYFPEEKLTYTMLSNGKDYNLETIHETVLKLVFNQPVKIPEINSFKVTASDLLPYVGTYISKESPLVISVTHVGNKLFAQPEGQRIYTMDAVEKDKFIHSESGVVLVFDSINLTMTMSQGGRELHFHKQ